MSVKVMTEVFDRYPNGGGEMLLALALADHASDDGTRVFPSVKALSDKTRQSERTVQYQLRRMEEIGWLILVGAGNGGRSMSREYRISLDWIKGADIAPIQKGAIDDINGATGGTKGCNLTYERVQPVAPANNHQNHQNHQLTVIGADAQKPTSGRATVISENFEPDATAAAMAAELGLSLADEWAAFADHHTANGSTFKDWQAAVRVWLRNSAKFAKRDAAKATGYRSACGTAETVYQRSMRERMQEAAPAIARKAPGAAPAMSAIEFFSTVEAAPALCLRSPQ